MRSVFRAGTVLLFLATCIETGGCSSREAGEDGQEPTKPKVVVKAQPTRPRAQRPELRADGPEKLTVESPKGEVESPKVEEAEASSPADSGPSRFRADVLPDFAATYDNASGGVVKITTYARASLVRGETRLALGAGFFFGEAGDILTNAHVVSGGGRFEVETVDGRKASARLVGQDPLTDVALLHVDLDNPPQPLAVAPPDTLRPGMWVLAIGNPLGLEFSATKGIVSALNRTDVVWDGVGYWDFIQTDAAINVGNSGGPLVDESGAVVGICAAIDKEGRKIGFAIPIGTARIVAKHLKTYGKLRRAWLGIQILKLEGEIKVVGIYPDSPAQAAGFLPGDVILELDGEPIDEVQQLRWKIAIHDIDTDPLFKVVRQGKELWMEVQLTEAPDPAVTGRR